MDELSENPAIKFNDYYPTKTKPQRNLRLFEFKGLFKKKSIDR